MEAFVFFNAALEINMSNITKNKHFVFTGGVGSYLSVGIVVLLLTIFTCGLGFPWAVCMLEQWKAENTYIDGRRLRFIGTGGELFILWIKWYLLTAITCGIYSLWIIPELYKWMIEHTDFELEYSSQPNYAIPPQQLHTPPQQYTPTPIHQQPYIHQSQQQPAYSQQDLIACRSCGASNPSSSRFCSTCNNSLSTSGQLPTLSLQVQAPKPEPLQLQAGNTFRVTNCIYCSMPLDDESIFCENCGKQVICQKCNTVLSPHFNACQRCGETVLPQ